MKTPIDGKQRAVGWVLGKYTVRNLQYVRLDDYDVTVIRSDARVAELNAKVEKYRAALEKIASARTTGLPPIHTSETPAIARKALELTP